VTQGSLGLAVHDRIERERVGLDAELFGGERLELEAIVGIDLSARSRTVWAAEEDREWGAHGGAT
jgi:hypothetical protein